MSELSVDLYLRYQSTTRIVLRGQIRARLRAEIQAVEACVSLQAIPINLCELGRSSAEQVTKFGSREATLLGYGYRAKIQVGAFPRVAPLVIALNLPADCVLVSHLIPAFQIPAFRWEVGRSLRCQQMLPTAFQVHRNSLEFDFRLPLDSTKPSFARPGSQRTVPAWLSCKLHCSGRGQTAGTHWWGTTAWVGVPRTSVSRRPCALPDGSAAA